MQVTIEGAVVARAEVPDAGHPQHSTHAHAHATGRDTLRDLVARLAPVTASEVLIEARCPDCGGPHGRPVVMTPPAARQVHVTLAYAGTSVVAAAVAGRSIGVDAELRDQGRHADARSRAIRALAPGSADDPLLHWTRIESVLKADGRGLRVGPERVFFDRHGASVIAGVPGDARRYEVRELALGDDLVVSVALEC